MVLQVMKWKVHPDKAEDFLQWTESAIKRTVVGLGVVEFRGYRPASGASQSVVTYEFTDMAAWAAWQSDGEVQKVLAELHTLASNVEIEIWGPSPIVPQPIRP